MNTTTLPAKKILRRSKQIKAFDAEAAIGLQVLRIEMAKADLTSPEMAALAGIRSDTFSAYLSRGMVNPKARARIENALDREIWSSAKVFAQRKAIRMQHGIDPELATAAELREVARNMGLHAPAAASRDDLTRLVMTAGAVKGNKE